MTITATLINYYHLCHRKLWLHAHEIRLEHSSELVAEGRLLHDRAYARRSDRYRELQLPGIKIDYFDPKARVVHEVKHSNKMQHAHRAQVLYYLWVLEQHGIAATARLEYPKLRQTTPVMLTDTDREHIQTWLDNIRQLLAGPCPARLGRPACRRCSFEAFCWSEEPINR